MNENIIQFLKKQTCATVCCLDHLFKPWCFSCFYVFNSKEELMYYKSSAGSNHGIMMKQNPQIAGTVLPDKLNKLRVRGI